jgi:superfamily II DNA or RNA helicase
VQRDLDAEIAQAKERIAELDRLRDDAAAHLRDLHRLHAPRAVEAQANNGGERSPASKARLFRDLFSGREDVFALRWENRVRGRAGYAPRCEHEWKPGVCGKPKVRCGACSNQAFVALDDRELLAHLQGHQVVGIYPLLPNDTCRLLAIDLDGSSWQSDARAIRETCRSLDLETAIERSRSGNGAHLWFFFAGVVAASDARRLGFMILTRTMASGAALGVESYDRLFPSQDVLPNGGLGNLIALPLQLQARKFGNTEFLNDELDPHQDQWSYLASVPRIAPDLLGELIARSEEDGALAVRSATEDSGVPWRPPRMLRERLRGESMPEAVAATLADRLYVDRSALPPALAHAIKRVATFSNPMFIELQRMRMSVARTPRVIGCFEDLDRHVAIPRGCLAEVEALLAEFDVRLDIQDERIDGEPLAIGFEGNLNDTQQRAVNAILATETGVLCAPPGWGKTVVATSLIAARGCSTLVLVHRTPLVEQWAARLSEFTDISPKAIGRLGGGRRRTTKQIDIAMVQTLARAEGATDFPRGYGHVVIDECHHVPAVSIERVLSVIPARYVTGLTATPYRRDGHQPIINMQCGSIRHEVDAAAVRQQHDLELLVVRRETSFDPTVLPNEASIQEIYRALAIDHDRLQLVVADARELLDEGRAVMILTERRDHLERLAESLREDVPNFVVLHGGIQVKARRAALKRLADLSADEPRLVLATGRYIGEGFDDPRLDTLLLTMPIAWKGTVVQYAGRLHRAHPAKRDTRIYDYVDGGVPVLRRMYGKRLLAYRKMGYSTDAQLACAT